MFINLSENKRMPSFYRTSSERLTHGAYACELGYKKIPSDDISFITNHAYSIHYISGGNGTFMQEALDNGYGYVTAPDELETLSIIGEMELSWIIIKGSGAPELLKKFNIPTHNKRFAFDKTAQCTKIIKDACLQSPNADPLTEMAIMQTALYKILSLHSQNTPRKSTETKPSVQRVAEYIDRNFNRQIKIDDIAEQFHMSRSSLYMKFKNEYDVSPKEYITNLRIEKAKQLMFDSGFDLSIKEIALAAGFDNQLYFSRLFRNVVGFSPSEYRSILNKQE